ncbi:MAG TPA: DMT family transporter [Paenalcaligenes sp.]|nr:DMT family transporter [Paenalcaligenes sp.]
MATTKAEQAALMLMTATVVLWSFSWIVMKSLVDYIGPVDMVASRYVIAFIFLGAVQYYRKVPFVLPPFLLCAGIAIFQTVAFQVLSQFALMRGGAGHVVLLAYTMPFWAVLFSWLILGARPLSKHWWALAFGLCGLLLVIRPWEGLGNASASLLALLSGISGGFGLVLSKIMFERHQPHILNLTVWQLLMGGLITVPLAYFVPQRELVLNGTLIIGLLYMSVLASGLGWLMWLGVIQRVSTTVASMSSLGVPVLAILLAWLLLGEQPSYLDLMGVALVVMGLVVVNWPSRRVANT